MVSTDRATEVIDYGFCGTYSWGQCLNEAMVLLELWS